jgi:hypothetical protein
MRGALWSILLLAFMSGCLEDDADDAEDGEEPVDTDGDGVPDAQQNATPPGTPPAAIHAEGRLVGAQGALTCDMDIPMTCADQPFTLDAQWNADIVLVMGSPVADYDLFLLDEAGQEIANSINGAGATDQINRDLPAGSYTVRVWAFEDPGTGYTLDVTFAAP